VDELPDGALVALDTMAFIYFVERNQRYYTILRPVFERISTGAIQAHASVISLLEALVLPFSARNAELEREYRELLSWSQLKLHVVDDVIAEMAARIRASDVGPDIRDEQRIRVADSIVASTALSAELHSPHYKRQAVASNHWRSRPAAG
jgi:predicted nucleic acid-binding protein